MILAFSWLPSLIYSLSTLDLNEPGSWRRSENIQFLSRSTSSRIDQSYLQLSDWCISQLNTSWFAWQSVASWASIWISTRSPGAISDLVGLFYPKSIRKDIDSSFKPVHSYCSISRTGSGGQVRTRLPNGLLPHSSPFLLYWFSGWIGKVIICIEQRQIFWFKISAWEIRQWTKKKSGGLISHMS